VIEMVDIGSSDLICKFPDTLSVADRSAILEDYGIATSYIELGLEVKLGCWQQLPWKCAGLGHSDASVRVETARAVLQLYDASIGDGYTPAMNHATTNKLLEAGSALRGHIESLAISGDMHEDLECAAAQLKFMPTAERAPVFQNW